MPAVSPAIKSHACAGKRTLPHRTLLSHGYCAMMKRTKSPKVGRRTAGGFLRSMQPASVTADRSAPNGTIRSNRFNLTVRISQWRNHSFVKDVSVLGPPTR